jgi:putative transposase
VPWKETSAVDERVRFIADYLAGVDSMTELAERYGVSRQTAYLWVKRYVAEGPTGLHDRSRRPHTRPNATAPVVVDALLAARHRHPTWGPKKLLGREWPLAERPALSTASAIRKKAGLVASPLRRRRPGHPGPPPSPIAAPNALWTIDFKGQFRTGDGQWCYPLTLIDSCSRYVLACQALPSTETRGARRVLERVFREYGVPDRIRSDNGVPFATVWAAARLSSLAIWWIRLGIVPELIEPGRPAQNGRHERFHRTLKRETAEPPAATLGRQQRLFTAYRQHFNHERPHEALGQLVPGDLYRPSTRAYPRELPPLIYPDDSLVRQVDTSGSIRWAINRRVYISHVLTDQEIAFRPVVDGLWAVYFGPVLLGHFDERRPDANSLAAVTRGRSPADAGSRPTSRNSNRVSTMSPD